jgi:hypothetical protein
MERVGVLIDKLQEQFLKKADVQNMLVTAQLLHTELLIQAKQTNGTEIKKVAVVVPHAFVISPQLAAADSGWSGSIQTDTEASNRNGTCS